MTLRTSPFIEGSPASCIGGGLELRLKQEDCFSGSAGGDLLGALGIQPEVCHLNEGHAAFAVLERARSFMQEDRAALRSCGWPSRERGTSSPPTRQWLPVLNRFDPALIEQYLGGYAPNRSSVLHFTICWLWAGRTRTTRLKVSTLAYLAIRGSGQ